MTHTSQPGAPADTERARQDLADMDDEELLEASTPRAEALCTTTVPIGELFPTMSARHYLTMPTALLPPRMHTPFGRRSWRDLMGLSPRELLEIRRIEPATVGALFVSLRKETAVAEAGRSS